MSDKLKDIRDSFRGATGSEGAKSNWAKIRSLFAKKDDKDKKKN